MILQVISRSAPNFCPYMTSQRWRITKSVPILQTVCANFSSVHSAANFRYNTNNKPNPVTICHTNHGVYPSVNAPGHKHCLLLPEYLIGNNSVHRRHFSADFYNKYLSTESPPIGLAQEVLEYVHTTTGLPWWASIMVTTFGLRTVITFPLAVYSQKVIAKVELLQPEIGTLAKRLKLEVAHATKRFNWSKKLARSKYNATMRKLISDLYIRENSHPFKASLVVWIQLPMWICFSFALRNMSGYVPIKGVEAAILAPGFVDEGFLWFSNLCLADATFILPVMLGVLNLMIIEMNILQTKNPTKFHTRITYLLRGVSLMMIPIAACVPSSMSWYWTCSSFYGLIQNVMMKFPSAKRTLTIPPTPSASETPFQDMYKEFHLKYGKLMKKKSIPVQKPPNDNK